MKDLQDKHAKGQQEVDPVERAPTGEPYQQAYRDSMQRHERNRAREEQERQEEVFKLKTMKLQMKQQTKEEKVDSNDNESQEDEYDSWLDDDDDDDELQAIRDRRIQEIRTKQMTKAENLAKGHGQYRQISQDDFLPECTSSRFVAIHFFHIEFERCKIMDHHLKIIAAQHLECKFLKMDSEKAPFFVKKLQIKTLPTVLVFCEGKTVARLLGFHGLASDPHKPDEFITSRLQQWFAETGAIDYTPCPMEFEEEMERLGLKVQKPIHSGGVRTFDEDF